MSAGLATDLERRKQIRLRLRPDLEILPHRYEGKTFYIVKDPVSLRYYRFKEQERFLLGLMDGEHTLEDAQKEFEKRFRPERLTLEDLEAFGQQLLTVGLAHNESPQAGKQLFDRRKKRLRREWTATLTNILYIKIPLIDPDRLLVRMLPWLWWIFTPLFFAASVLFMLSAVFLVATHFDTFMEKLPSYQEFFRFKTVVYLWIALGIVKVIHEFGHGLSCKAFGGEVHEMGFLLLCLSPCLYCNVSDAWTMPNKWYRIIISFAGIYVELVIAALATFIWWYTPSQPFINNLALSLMVVCSVSTVVFNGNPLMRFDGYYILADWLEIPNLRDRSNRFLKNLVLEKCLGVETQPEPYMALNRRILFVTYAVVSYIYRWVITFSILYFLYSFLKPYKLQSISAMLALAALGSLIGWPLYRFAQGLHKRGRLPDMKKARVSVTVAGLVGLLLFFFLVPLPVSRVRETALVQLQPEAITHVYVPYPGGMLEYLPIRYGQQVEKQEIIARFRNIGLENELEDARTQQYIRHQQILAYRSEIDKTPNRDRRAQLEVALRSVEGELEIYQARVTNLEERLRGLVVRAPVAGVILNPPHLDEVGKLWDKDVETPLCGIADPNQLRVLMPVSPADFRLLKEDVELARKTNDGELAVTIRVQGQGSHTCRGMIAYLPESEAREVPLALTTRGGGPLAVKPSPDPKQLVPQTQQYLVAINFLEPDLALCPGTLAQVKVHCRWRTAAWWVWRKIASTFEIGLI
ncbi:MAG: site-2 protease family protein [Gemmataceae bacterium]